MRPIKFRAWDKKKGAWIPYKEMPVLGIGNTLMLPIDDKGRIEWMQYTGLFDFNGKEIYESDLCRYGIRIGEVFWENTGWKLKPRMQDGTKWEYDTTDPLFTDVEIIGNIYETKP